MTYFADDDHFVVLSASVRLIDYFEVVDRHCSLESTLESVDGDRHRW